MGRDKSFSETALHPSTSLTVKNGFLRLYSDVLRNDPSKAEDIDVFELVARTVRDVHLNSLARQNGLNIIETFLSSVPHWADSTVGQAVMKKRYYGWEHDAFDTLKEKRPDLVEQEWLRKQKARETALSDSEPLAPAKHRTSLPGATAQPA